MNELDRRSLGSRPNLSHVQEDAPGMAFWHPRAYAVYRMLEDYVWIRIRRLRVWLAFGEMPSRHAAHIRWPSDRLRGHALGPWGRSEAVTSVGAR
jgi:hypothetical protein